VPISIGTYKNNGTVCTDMTVKIENEILVQCDECIRNIKINVEKQIHFEIIDFLNNAEESRKRTLEYIVKTLYNLNDYYNCPKLSREKVTTDLASHNQFKKEEIDGIFEKYSYKTTDYSQEFLSSIGVSSRILAKKTIESLGDPLFEWPFPDEMKYNFPFSDCDYTKYLGLCRMDVEILECSDCGRKISNSPSNVTFGSDKSIICPVCVNEREDEFDIKGLIRSGNPTHHGTWDTQEPEFLFSGTDYFLIAHPKCKKSERPDGKGPMLVNGVWMDSCGRLVLGLECIYCGARNALKPFIKDKQIPLLDESGAKWRSVKSPILQAIETGEGKKIEFKAYLKLNPFTKKEGTKQIEKVIHGICGFLNADGGTLLIGVANDKKIIGIEHEYQTFGRDKKNIDGFQLKVCDILTTSIDSNMMKFIDIDFAQIEEHDVCAIYVGKSNTPCFFKNKLFVRESGRAVGKDMPEAHQYIISHWDT